MRPMSAITEPRCQSGMRSSRKSSFRIRAYENAAKAVRNLTEDVRTLSAAGTLTSVPGIGKGISTAIDELLTTGSIQQLEHLRAQFPPGVRSLMKVPGVGPVMA